MGTTTARAQPAPQAQGPRDPYGDEDDADEPDETAPEQGPVEAAPVQPPTAAPRAQPPAPPVQPPPAPVQQQVQVQAQPVAPSATGQWVYTQQYGWVYMPYGDQYVYTPNGGNVYPSEYVYTPSYGWSWVVAPWVWGWGPSVTFSFGPRYYGWYHHPHFIGRGFVGRGAVVHGFRGFRGNVGVGHFGGHVGGSHFGGHVGGGHSGHGGHGHR